MDIIEIINSRRNTKSFKSDTVQKELINKWLQAGTMAPNHKMTEPWEVYWVGEATRTKLNHKTNFFNAPIVLAILSKHGANEIETTENTVATACFVQNFNLAAWADGVGTFWSSLAVAPKIREILAVPEGYDVIGVFGVGYPEEVNPPRERTAILEKMKYLP
ncbi:nitroreductase family protein [Paenibacillus sinopodophylli]|uniref:nitroreductase family protein n=1 Tax=Paenibacillus sinopodophylli TaxID=1837342 RepID=UPI00110CAC76|nr:nitroreductase family protein [Paenibacillus sinopodophylli]